MFRNYPGQRCSAQQMHIRGVFALRLRKKYRPPKPDIKPAASCPAEHFTHRVYRGESSKCILQRTIMLHVLNHVDVRSATRSRITAIRINRLSTRKINVTMVRGRQRGICMRSTIRNRSGFGDRCRYRRSLERSQ